MSRADAVDTTGDRAGAILSDLMNAAEVAYQDDERTVLVIDAESWLFETLTLFGAWSEDLENDDPEEDADPKEDDDPGEDVEEGWLNPQIGRVKQINEEAA
ncbi:MAG: hypothetical protein RLO50_14520 [Azospirillaceae bacterium]